MKIYKKKKESYSSAANVIKLTPNEKQEQRSNQKKHKKGLTNKEKCAGALATLKTKRKQARPLKLEKTNPISGGNKP